MEHPERQTSIHLHWLGVSHYSCRTGKMYCVAMSRKISFYTPSLYSGGTGKAYCTELLVVLRIKVPLAIFQLYRNLEAGDNQSLKS